MIGCSVSLMSSWSLRKAQLPRSTQGSRDLYHIQEPARRCCFFRHEQNQLHIWCRLWSNVRIPLTSFGKDLGYIEIPYFLDLKEFIQPHEKLKTQIIKKALKPLKHQKILMKALFTRLKVPSSLVLHYLILLEAYIWIPSSKLVP